MPQSLSCLIAHIVFSTKDRAPLIDQSILGEFHAYLATIIRNTGCDCYRIGGVADHVHAAVRLSRILTVAQLIEEMKTTTSKWLKKQSPNFKYFSWQRGYGAFSLSIDGLDALVHYIDTQHEHHQTISFQDEYRAFLDKYKIAFDEKYVWD